MRRVFDIHREHVEERPGSSWAVGTVVDKEELMFRIRPHCMRVYVRIHFSAKIKKFLINARTFGRPMV